MSMASKPNRYTSRRLGICRVRYYGGGMLTHRYIISDENKEKFFKFILERQTIYHKRFVDKLPPPWTDDHVLRQYKFCNVYRQLDRGTILLLDKIIKRDDISLGDLLFNIVAYRLFMGSDQVFNYLGVDHLSCTSFDPYYYIDVLDKVRDKYGKIFGTAYLVAGWQANKDYRPREKHVQICFALEKLSNMINNGFAENIFISSSADKAFNRILDIPLAGSFLAYEIYCDLSYSDSVKFTDDDYLNIGPGAYDGLKILLDLPTNSDIRDDLSYMVYDLRDCQKSFLNDNWKKVAFCCYPCYPYLSIRNIEHSLCEYRKYDNAVNNRGKKRIFYPNNLILKNKIGNVSHFL